MKIAAADIGGTHTKIGICDELGAIERFREFPTESHLGGPHVMNRLLERLAAYDEQCDAIAISTAGQVDTEKGRIVFANDNIPNYTGTAIREIVENRFGKPVKVENDVNAAALGEARFGAGEPYRDFLCLTFGTGVGGAIVMDRRIYRGADGVAGEFGHLFTHPLSETVGGRKPYYEAYASTTALVRMAKEADSECVDGKAIFDKIKRGNDALLRVVDAWIAEVAAGLASLVHIFNPSAIIVGGGVMEQDFLVRMVEERTRSLVLESFGGVRILKASLGNKAGLLGAASLYFS
ncbi:ROK family protein [Cohnella faecalis]|uniref:ROK family protein n=2 Tax=Cohnella faecalis TaxID=2315694 RepID=A0A398CY96_9BACL|nr:ROK family protein [Cohnella faecalis]